MKRSPLPPRRKPIKRTALKRGKGKKAKREQNALDAAREILKARSRCRCEIDIYGLFAPCGRAYGHEGQHPHHVWPEDRDAGLHDPTRMLWVCAAGHRWIHDHPADASRLGLLRPTERGFAADSILVDDEPR